jgi:hypothetical protein
MSKARGKAGIGVLGYRKKSPVNNVTLGNNYVTIFAIAGFTFVFMKSVNN